MKSSKKFSLLTLVVVLLAAMAFASCSKEVAPPSAPHQERVGTSKWM
ncbi:MAG TPA: hypothetical protein VK783_13760 [Bacteroidia bacterium]|nr:hypothetical protein [Bacteroidia bacterium]